jgi:hypothetical protein
MSIQLILSKIDLGKSISEIEKCEVTGSVFLALFSQVSQKQPPY